MILAREILPAAFWQPEGLERVCSTGTLDGCAGDTGEMWVFEKVGGAVREAKTVDWKVDPVLRMLD